MKAELVYEISSILGEGPLWHPGRQSLFWVDIEKKLLHEHDAGSNKNRVWLLDRRVSTVVQDLHQGLVLGMQGGIAAFDPDSGKLDWLKSLEEDQPGHRSNDGKCDNRGRFWIGTMGLEAETGVGALYCIDTDLSVSQKDNALSIPNGMAWSRDNKRFYHIDSPRNIVRSFFYDEETGVIRFEKNAIEIPFSLGSPDGMAMDEEGMLWIAVWGGFGLYRYDPSSGKLLGKIEVPVPQVSSCAFGGPGNDELYITTASERMSRAEIDKYPLSGSLFKVKAGVCGIPVNRFGGYPR